MNTHESSRPESAWRRPFLLLGRWPVWSGRLLMAVVILSLLASLGLSFLAPLADLPVLTLVSGLSLIFSLVLLWKRHGKAARNRLKQHVEHTLPTMSGETLLFLSAGVLAAGLGAMVQAAEFQLSLNGFGPWHAWGLLVLMVFVSAIGVHPVISIATAGGLVAPWVSDPNMLAMVFLMGWALGVGVSPLSGTHLTMQGRYGISAFKFPRWNLGFVLVMLLVDLLVLQLYGFVA